MSVGAGWLAGESVPGVAERVRAITDLTLTRAPAGLAVVVAVFAHNACAALWPLALIALRLHVVRGVQQAVTGLVFASLLVNGTFVGLALSAYGWRLVPLILQLPVEWLGLALPAAAWISACGRRPLAVAAVITSASMTLALAAVIEVYAGLVWA